MTNLTDLTPRRTQNFVFRLSDTERELIAAAASKEDSSQSAIVRRGAVAAAREILANVNDERAEQ